MPTEVIPRNRWSDFLDGFNRVHRGWLVTVESSGGVLVREVPLASVVLDDEDVVVETAKDRQHTDHVVRKATDIRVERAGDGADRYLEITGLDEGRVRVRFRTAVRPELVDGIASPGHT